MTSRSLLTAYRSPSPLHRPSRRARGRENEKRLHQALGLHYRLDLNQVLGNPGAGVEGGNVHKHGGERTISLLSPALGGGDRGARDQRDAGVPEQPEGKPIERLQ